MEIFAKSAFIKGNIAVKKRIGCDGIEIQLLNELLEDWANSKFYKLEDVFNLDELKDEPISAVHMPIIGGQDTTIERLSTFKNRQLFYEVCRLANLYGQKQNKNIIIIIHCEIFYDFIKNVGTIWDDIKETIKTALDMYPYIKIAIENVSPLRSVYTEGMRLYNNFMFDNVEIVNKLREELCTDKIGTVLDTCHAMLADKYISCLIKEIGDIEPVDLSMDNYFKQNKDVVFLIHLADMKGSGIGKGKHGIPFYEETKETCEYFLSLYKKYKYTCPITLEVAETDYLVCDGYKSTKKIVDDILNN